MLTPQEVSGHAFPRASFGGYNMTAVDEFLDELTDDYTALYKENAALKAKLKVLVEKVDDYRATEDSMRATLLTAQRMADSIVKEAEQKRQQMMDEAESAARARVGQLQDELLATQERLRVGKQELAEFVGAVEKVCQQELESLKALPELPVDLPAQPAPQQPAEQQESAVDEIEKNIYASFAAEDAQQEPETASREPEEAAPAESAAEDYPEGNPFEEPAEGDGEPTRRLDLKELKFGRNYSGK